MSEAVFLTACLLGYIFAERAGRARAGYRWSIYLGIALMAIFVIRSAGIIIMVALILDLVLAKGKEAVKPVLVALIAALLALLLVLVLTPAQAGDIFSPLARYASEYRNFTEGDPIPEPIRADTSFPVFLAQRAYAHIFRDMRGLIFAAGGGNREVIFWADRGLPVLEDSVGWVVSSLALLGIIIALLREGGSAFSISALAYLALTLFWNWFGERLLYPILPQLMFGMGVSAVAIAKLAQRLLPRLRSYTWLPVASAGAMACVIAAGFSYRISQIEPSQLHAGSMTARTEWIRANTSSDVILLSELPFIDYLYSGRLVVQIPSLPSRLTTEAGLVDFLKNQNIDYVLVTPRVEWQEVYVPRYSNRLSALIPLLVTLENKGKIQQVSESVEQGIQVYRVLK
jgi:hypothetical protein